MLAVERQSMWQPKLARFCSFAAHSANKAPFRRKLMYVVVGRGHPHLILVVDRDGKVLGGGNFRMIGIAEPHNAPYGAAAQQVLTTLGLWDKLNQDKKLAVGENINQAWQFAATGNVDMAFVALSQVISSDVITGSYWLPPQAMYAPLDQDAVILARTEKRATAEAFMSWLRKDPQAIATIKAAGYHVRE